MKKNIKRILSLSTIFMVSFFNICEPISAFASSGSCKGLTYELQSDGRYNVKRKNPTLQIFYSNHSWTPKIRVDGSEKDVSSLTLEYDKSNADGSIEQKRKIDSNSSIITKLTPVNGGNYVKIEYIFENKSSSTKKMELYQYWDTAIAGNDRSPFKVTKNGFIAYSGDSQVSVLTKDSYGVVNPTSIFIGRYGNSGWNNNKGDTYSEGQIISPGDSACAFWWEDMYVPSNSSKSVSIILGAGEINNAPEIKVNEPISGGLYYQGQILKIKGNIKDIDKNDLVTIKWAIDDGNENTLSTLTADGTNQSFALDYALPEYIKDGPHTLTLWAMDNKGGTSVVNKINFNIKNFRTPHDIKTIKRTDSSLDLVFLANGNEPSTMYLGKSITLNKDYDLGTKRELQVKNLEPNKKYEFKFKALNSKGEYTNYSSVYSTYTLPSIPEKKKFELNKDNSVTLVWDGKLNPIDTKYKYEIISKKTGKILKSGDVIGDSTTINNVPQNEYVDVYVKALCKDETAETDRVFMGETFVDTENPNLSLEIVNKNYTNKTVTIKAIANDNLKVQCIKIPNGNLIQSNEVEYTVNKNGIYYFEAIDTFGNSTITSLRVDIIDIKKPIIKIENNKEWINKDVEVKISAKDE